MDFLSLERVVVVLYFSVNETSGLVLRVLEEFGFVEMLLLEWLHFMLFLGDGGSCTWGAPSSAASWAHRYVVNWVHGLSHPLGAFVAFDGLSQPCAR